jgi:hypothetical protein
VVVTNLFAPTLSLIQKSYQILKAEHRFWISALITFQIAQLDKENGEITENAIEPVTGLGSTVEATPSLSDIEPHFTLGSKQSPGRLKKKLVIGELQAAGPTFDPAFTSFRSRISSAIQRMSSEPTNIVDDLQEVL